MRKLRKINSSYQLFLQDNLELKVLNLLQFLIYSNTKIIVAGMYFCVHVPVKFTLFLYSIYFIIYYVSCNVSLFVMCHLPIMIGAHYAVSIGEFD